MITAIAFVLAAATGALARADAGRRWNRRQGMAWGTLGVNVAGSLALGLMHNIDPPVLTVVGIGGLGAFTTFSSFARDAIALVEGRRPILGIVYVLASCAAGVTAAALGIALV